MQKVTLIGRLGRDAAVRETQDGGKLVSFTMAVDAKYRGVDQTYWYDVATFNYLRYKNMVQYLKKGSTVVVGGDLIADVEEGRDGQIRCRRNVTADYIEFGPSNGNGEGKTRNERSSDDAPEDEPVETPERNDAPEEDDEPTTRTTKPKATAKAKPAAKPKKEEPEEAESEDGESELPF